MITHQTENCVICGKPAVQFTGHVHKHTEQVIAGHCEEHRTNGEGTMKDCIGCFGQWIPAYGIDLSNNLTNQI